MKTIYDGTQSRQLVILESGTVKGFDYLIVTYRSHPCCYVKLPNDHPRAQFKNEEYYKFDDIPCHGGVTYVETEFHCDLSETKIDAKGYWIGWDYNHYGDYSITRYSPDLEPFVMPGRTWTFEELKQETLKVIDYLDNGW